MWPFSPSRITRITNALETIMGQLDQLIAQVEQNTQVEASAVTLIQGIAAQLEEFKTQPEAISALAANLQASAAALAAAVAANTPAA